MRVIIHPTYFSNLFSPFSLFPFFFFFFCTNNYPRSLSSPFLPLSIVSLLFRTNKNFKRIAFNPKCLQFDETRVSLSKTVVNSRPVKQRVTVISINVIRVNPIHIAKRFIHLDPSVSHFSTRGDHSILHRTTEIPFIVSVDYPSAVNKT